MYYYYYDYNYDYVEEKTFWVRARANFLGSPKTCGEPLNRVYFVIWLTAITSFSAYIVDLLSLWKLPPELQGQDLILKSPLEKKIGRQTVERGSNRVLGCGSNRVPLLSAEISFFKRVALIRTESGFQEKKLVLLEASGPLLIPHLFV